MLHNGLNLISVFASTLIMGFLQSDGFIDINCSILTLVLNSTIVSPLLGVVYTEGCYERELSRHR